MRDVAMMSFKRRFLRGFPGMMLGALFFAFALWHGYGLWVGVMLPMLVGATRLVYLWCDPVRSRER